MKAKDKKASRESRVVPTCFLELTIKTKLTQRSNSKLLRPIKGYLIKKGIIVSLKTEILRKEAVPTLF